MKAYQPWAIDFEVKGIIYMLATLLQLLIYPFIRFLFSDKPRNGKRGNDIRKRDNFFQEIKNAANHTKTATKKGKK
jgi:hypothetical protein